MSLDQNNGNLCSGKYSHAFCILSIGILHIMRGMHCIRDSRDCKVVDCPISPTVNNPLPALRQRKQTKPTTTDGDSREREKRATRHDSADQNKDAAVNQSRRESGSKLKLWISLHSIALKNSPKPLYGTARLAKSDQLSIPIPGDIVVAKVISISTASCGVMLKRVMA